MFRILTGFFLSLSLMSYAQITPEYKVDNEQLSLLGKGVISLNTKIKTDRVEFTQQDSSELIKKHGWALLSGTYPFGEHYQSCLPNCSKDYFIEQDFPYKLEDSLVIDYDAKRKTFGFKDFYIFNKLNKSMACEYVALVDTCKFIQIVAQQTVDMENWLKLFVVDQNYNIVDSKPIILSEGGTDDEAVEYEGFDVLPHSVVDSLEFYKGRYILKHDELYRLTDKLGQSKMDIGYKRIQVLTIDDFGKIQARDSLVRKKKYVVYHRLF